MPSFTPENILSTGKNQRHVFKLPIGANTTFQYRNKQHERIIQTPSYLFKQLQADFEQDLEINNCPNHRQSEDKISCSSLT
jgi:hypothetical protein